MGIRLETIPTQSTEDSQLNLKHHQVTSWKYGFPLLRYRLGWFHNATTEESNATPLGGDSTGQHTSDLSWHHKNSVPQPTLGTNPPHSHFQKLAW